MPATPGQATLSEPTTLPGDVDLSEGRRPVVFELFVPVYETDQPLLGAAEHRRPGSSAPATSWRRP